MRATIMHAAGDVRIENVADARIIEHTDAVIRVTRACICGSDLWPYRSMPRSDQGQRMGHEAIRAVESVGHDVRKMKRGDVVVMPFASSDGTCVFCHEGLTTACVHIGFMLVERLDRSFKRMARRTKSQPPHVRRLQEEVPSLDSPPRVRGGRFGRHR